MEPREVLFPDSNITGYTDRNNKPILVGQKLRDESGTTVNVGECSGIFLVSHTGDLNLYNSTLGLWITMCEWVEIVVHKPEHNTASEAIAPFNDKEVMSNSQASDYLHGTHFGPTKPSRKIKRRY